MSDQGDIRDRRTAFIRQGGTRKHMGTATSDPDYLTPTGFEHGRSEALTAYENARREGSGGARKTPAPGKRRMKDARAGGQLHYDRYLSTPKPGRSIFISQQDRQRRRLQRVLAVLILLAIALALAWFFLLR